MIAKPIAMRDSLLQQILFAMERDKTIFFISADFGSPVLDKIREKFPERFLNVGIAEQNLINISAGLAIEGYKVFAYAIATFITMRCYEQIRVSLALLSKIRNINVTLIGVGAGYSYVVSGPTHQCYEDLSLMRALPNMQIYSPSDHVSSASLLDACLSKNGPKYLRLDAQVLPVLYEANEIDMTKGFYVHQQAQQIYLLATGYMTHVALKVSYKLAKYGIHVGVIDLFNITNFSNYELQKQLVDVKFLITMEEGFRARGGLDSMFFDWVACNNLQLKILNIGVDPDYNFDLGTRIELHEQVGIGEEIVTKKILKFLLAANFLKHNLKTKEIDDEISFNA